MNFAYRFAVMGGTFDRLHAGHKKMLELAFSCAETVVIGLTGDGFITDKVLSRLILHYPDRHKELSDYIISCGFDGRFEIVKIEDVYGTTLVDKRFDVIVVSEETKKGAEMVNKKREELNLPILPVKIAELVNDEDGEKISSARIRAGFVDRVGTVYANVFGKTLIMDEEQRKILSAPMDEAFSGNDLDSYTKVVVVGDRTLNYFQAEKLRCDIAVYDLKIGRKQMIGRHQNTESETIVANEPGRIDSSAAAAIGEVVRNGTGMVRVVGEEDLLVLPMIMFLPLNSVVVYGQPDNGMVGLVVNEESKQKWYEFLKKG